MFFEAGSGNTKAPERSEHQIAAVYRKVCVIVNESESLQVLFDALSCLLSAVFGVTASGACVLSGKSLVFISARGEMQHMANSQFKLSQDQLNRFVLASKSVLLKRSEVSDDFLEHSRNADFQELLIASINLDGRPYGVIGVSSQNEAYFSQGDLTFINDIATFVALLLEQRRAFLRAAELSHFRRVGNLGARFMNALQTPLVEILRLTDKSNSDKGYSGFFDFAAAEQLSKILVELDSLAKPMQEMQALSQLCSEEEDEEVLCDLKDVVEEICKLMDSELESVARVEREFEETLPKISVVYLSLSKVIRAILLNAVTAIERAEASDDHLIRIRAYLQPQQIILEITDTGCGIASADFSRIYDPFFSTWPKHKGLGLSYAKLALLRMGGELEITKAKPRGTRARLFIPVANHHQLPSVF